jgi:uncharacterized protein YkwD
MTDLRPRRPRRIVARTLGLGMSSLVAAGLLTWAPAATSGWSQGAAESTLWQLMNGARSNNGMAPVQQHGTLVSLARWRSSDMLANDYFSHTIESCGCLVYVYYDSNGLNYDWAGENIGWNAGLDDSYSPVRVHEKFMQSPGHRANVLDPRFTHGGVGAAAANGKMFQGYVQNTRMYTELFMQAAVAAPPPPAPAPQPQPPSSGGGGGGGGSAAPVAPAAPAAPDRPKRPPKPKPAHRSMDVPARPRSSVGVDGVAAVVSAPANAAMLLHLQADELAAARAAALAVNRPLDAPMSAMAATTATTASMEVSAPPTAEAGFLDGLVGAVLGFLFG